MSMSESEKGCIQKLPFACSRFISHCSGIALTINREPCLWMTSRACDIQRRTGVFFRLKTRHGSVCVVNNLSEHICKIQTLPVNNVAVSNFCQASGKSALQSAHDGGNYAYFAGHTEAERNRTKKKEKKKRRPKEGVLPSMSF